MKLKLEYSSCIFTILLGCMYSTTLLAQRVELTWTPSKEPDISFYGLYRAIHLDSTFTLINTVNHPDSTYVDEDVRLNSHYFYAATVFNRLGNESGFSNIIEIKTHLPISAELIGFSGRANDDDVLLEWLMATASGNYEFEVQRSQDSTAKFTKIGFVKRSGPPGTAKDYRFVDKDLAVGTYYYLLKQIDSNGDIQFSKIVRIPIALPTAFRLYQNYPNPFNASTTISYGLSQGGQVELKVYDMNGREINKLVDEFQVAGRYRVNWDGIDFQGAKVTSGIYYYRIKALNGSKFRRMIFLK